MTTTDRIYHATFERDWTDAQAAGEYRLSTRGARLEDVGFIHTSFDHQVERIGALLYANESDSVVVLVIDPELLDSPLRVEPGHDGGELFPHIYGPLPASAVVAVLPAQVVDGEFVVAGLTKSG